MLLCRKIEILLALSATSLPHFSIAVASHADPLSETTQRRADPSFVPYGFQSGAPVTATYENDDSYAGSIAIDHENGLLYLTGGTYSRYFDKAQTDSLDGNSHLDTSDCFVSVLKLPDLVSDPSRRKASSETVPDPSTQPQLIFAQRFGTESNREVCSAVQYLPVLRPDGSSQQKVVSIGHTEGSDGFFTSLRRAGSDISTVYGFVMDFDLSINDNEQLESTGTLNGGMLFHENKVQYPVAFVSTPPRDGAAEMQVMYVLTMESDLGDVNPDFATKMGDKADSHVHPDLTAGGGGGLQEFGKNFDMTIRKLSWKGDDILKNEAATSEGVKRMMKEEWSRTYSPEGDEDVFASSLLYIASNSTEEDMLIIAGSTRGVGEEFGSSAISNSMDGFVTKLSLPSAGSALASIGTSSARVTGSSEKDIYVTAICANPTNNVQEFFISGRTIEANDIFHAFISKISLDGLEPIWTKKLGAVRNSDHVLGIGCAVTPDGKDVYLAGTVKNNAVIDLSDEKVEPIKWSSGGDDIFVAKFDVDDGNLSYAKQMGSRADETLARGGNGGGIVTDSGGNAILMGTTRGDFMRSKAGNNANDESFADIFLISVSRETGEFRESMDGAGNTPHGAVWNESIDRGVFLLVITLLSFMGSIIYFTKDQFGRIIHSKYWRDKEEAEVSQYLDDFGDIEVEIRHSATGGFHGMYDFPDYDGAPPDEVTVSFSPTDPRFNASIVRDSLFLEDDSDIVYTSRNNGEDNDNDSDSADAISHLTENDAHVNKHSDGQKQLRRMSTGHYGVADNDESSWQEQHTLDDEETSVENLPEKESQTIEDATDDISLDNKEII